MGSDPFLIETFAKYGHTDGLLTHQKVSRNHKKIYSTYICIQILCIHTYMFKVISIWSPE